AENPRETEYRLFALITSELMSAAERGRGDLPGLAKALDRNRRMWTVFAQDCAQEGNALPPPIRAQIISLSLWVSRHSSSVMRAEEDLAPLIDVNRAVMQGLAPAQDLAAAS